MSKKSLILVIIQFSSFLFFGVTRGLFASNYFLLVLQIIGLAIGLWGIIAMKMGNFNIQPEVKSHARMVSSGPYSIIRNPMYSGLLLFFGIAVFANFSFLRLAVLVILATVLILKIFMEEGFLEQKFGEIYTSYKQKTYRLIPYVF